MTKWTTTQAMLARVKHTKINNRVRNGKSNRPERESKGWLIMRRMEISSVEPLDSYPDANDLI